MAFSYFFCSIYECSRLDNALVQILNISRNQSQSLFESNLVLLNGKIAKKSQALNIKDEIKILKKETNKDIKKVDFNIQIIYECDDYMVLNKPKSLVVHGALSVKETTLSDILLANNYHLSTISGEDRAGIVHRLDKDTSGAILIAKNNYTHARFSDMLKNREIGRIYICVINEPLKQDMFIECSIGRNPNNRLKMAKLDKSRFPNARDSKSEFRKIMISNDSKYELIAVRLYSGRTHQIRVHLSTINRYIYGDTLYSPKNLNDSYCTKMLLHAILLYVDRKYFFAEIPNEMMEFLQKHFENVDYKLKDFITKWKDELAEINGGV